MTTTEPLGPPVPNRLGCADNYEAVIHFQGGKQVHCPLDSVTEAKWGRKLDDYSEGSVKLAKRQLSPDCWRKLGGEWDVRNYVDPRDGVMRKWLHMIEPGVEPWMHELTIYRDKGIVWQGPIIEVIETRDEIEIQARDVLFWLDRRVIDITYNDPADPTTQLPRNAGEVCRQVMSRTFPVGDPYNNPNIAEHWDIRDTPAPPPGDIAQKTIWKGSRTVGDLIRDVITAGIDMFTMGRKIFMIPDFDRTDPAIRSPYRLTDEHFMDGLEIHKLGLDLATEGFVISQPQNDSPDATNNPAPLYGKWPCPEDQHGSSDPSTPPWYGRVTRFDESDTRGAPVTSPEPPPYCPELDDRGQRRRSLQEAAKAIREYGFPCPKAITVPDGATLAPETPLDINQLVPGRAFIVEMTDWVTPISEIFRLNEVEVTWTAPSDSGSSGGTTSSAGGGTSGSSSGPEKVQISLATTRAPAPVDDTGGTE